MVDPKEPSLHVITAVGGRLVYYEGPFEFAVALQRERQLKRWTRAKKLALIQNQTLVLSRLSQSRERDR